MKLNPIYARVLYALDFLRRRVFLPIRIQVWHFLHRSDKCCVCGESVMAIYKTEKGEFPACTKHASKALDLSMAA
jgi:hypothetical protein